MIFLRAMIVLILSSWYLQAGQNSVARARTHTRPMGRNVVIRVPVKEATPQKQDIEAKAPHASAKPAYRYIPMARGGVVRRPVQTTTVSPKTASASHESSTTTPSAATYDPLEHADYSI